MGVLNGLWNLLVGLVAIGIGGFASSLGASDTGAAAGLLGVLVLVIGVGMLLAAGGLFTGQQWGWTAAFGAWGLASLKSIYGIATGEGLGIVTILVLLLNVAIVGVALSESEELGVSGGGEPSTYGD